MTDVDRIFTFSCNRGCGAPVRAISAVFNQCTRFGTAYAVATVVGDEIICCTTVGSQSNHRCRHCSI
ncbi:MULTISPECIES: hypothetical protein, partial [unclassified Acinetobacter]|uniref:hypothetical protein n=1 Tax=unclassified Acinetobacter TaxID=196816 RepID=UPI001C5501D8